MKLINCCGPPATFHNLCRPW